MTEREKFERFAEMPPRNWSLGRWPNDPSRYGWPGQYQNYATQCAWEGWQARADASTHKAVYEDEVCKG